MARAASTPFRNIALAAASTLSFAALLEGAARLLEPPPVQREEYLWDWSERFKDGEFYTLEKGEGYPPTEETNVDGLRDVTHPMESDPALTRIVVLGDSVAFGHGLEAHEAFPQQLQKVADKNHMMAEVHSVALPGWSTRQERIAYERIARKYKPGIVLLAVCLNDIAELQINLSKPPSPILVAMFRRSALVRFVMGASRREIGAVEELFSDPAPPRVEAAYRLFFDEVRALRDAVQRDGAKFYLVTFPFRFQVEANAPPPEAQVRIGHFADDEKVPELDFLMELRKEARPADLFLDYDHFNAAGHRRIAEWLASDAFTKADNAYPEVRHLLGGFVFDEGPPAPSPREMALSNARDLLKDGDTSESSIRVILEHLEEVAPTPGARGALRDALIQAAVTSTQPRTRFAAANAVFRLGLPGASSVPALIRGVRHEDPRVRAFATWTLGEMGPIAKDAIPSLVALAELDGGAGKTGALTAIGKIGGDSPETIPLLLKELKHPKENRRYRAARTIGRMGIHGAPALDGLIAALQDESALVRRTAVEAIGELGEAGKAAVPALTPLLNSDPEPDVRQAVSRTLSKLPGR